MSAATKNMRTKDTFFLKPNCFLLIRETRTKWQIFEVGFDYIRKHSPNRFSCKTYAEGVLEDSSTSISSDFKYGSAYSFIYKSVA